MAARKTEPQTPVCPEHRLALILMKNPVGAGKILRCPQPDCQVAMMAPRLKSKQIRMQFGPGERAQVVDHEKEAAVQRRIVQMLRLRGYIVLETSERRKKIQCVVLVADGNQIDGCGRWFFPSGGRGTSKGVPDLIVRHPKWPPYVWLGIEIKGSHTPFSCDEQRQLAAIQAICVARTDEEAWEAVQAFDIYIRGEGTGPIRGPGAPA